MATSHAKFCQQNLPTHLLSPGRWGSSEPQEEDVGLEVAQLKSEYF